ncbi:MAG: hypothetical protein D6729_07285, partial [Deltaproteobacteria bacterium]
MRRSRLWLVGAGVLLHAVVAAATDLSPDEAYYAAWARDLHLVYPDHPPLVAWLLAALRGAFGESTFVVRLPALVTAAVLPLLLAAAAERWTRIAGGGAADAVAAGTRAVYLASGTLFLHALGVVTTPDTPLILAWGVALWGLLGVLSEGRPAQVVLLGLACGLACLAKHSGWLLLLSVIGALWRRPAAAAAVLGLTLVVSAPWWAAVLGKGGGDLAFQAARLGRPEPFRHLPAFVAGQIALLTPGVAWVLAKCGRALRGGLAWLFWPTALVFFLAAAWVRAEANWAAPAWLPVLVAASTQRVPVPRWAAFSSGALVLAAHLVAIGGLPPPLPDPTARLRGWAVLGAELQRGCPEEPLAARHYALVSELAFYAPACRPIRAVPDGRRDFFDGGPPLTGPLRLVQRSGAPLPRGCRVSGSATRA